MLATIYDYEPNFEKYSYHNQWLIKGIYGFENLMMMSMIVKDDLRFIDMYCKAHKLDFPEELELLKGLMF